MQVNGEVRHQYEIGLFRGDDELASAVGNFTHVYVERASNRPVPIPEAARRVLSELAAAQQS